MPAPFFLDNIRIHITYERFFDGLGGLPKFKRKDRYRSAKFQSAYQLENGRVRLSLKAWDAARDPTVETVEDVSSGTLLSAKHRFPNL